MRSLCRRSLVVFLLPCACASAVAPAPTEQEPRASAAVGAAPSAAAPSSSAAAAPVAPPKIEGIPDGAALTNASVGPPLETLLSSVVIDSSGDGYVDVTVFTNGLDEQVKSVAYVLEEARSMAAVRADCRVGRVLFEIPRALLLDPRSQGARLVFRLAPPLVDVHKAYALTPCGRDAEGALHASTQEQTNAFTSEVSSEPRWASRVDTASGPITSMRLAPGDEILGFDVERKKTTVLPVEAVETTSVPHVSLLLDDGRSVDVPSGRELFIPSTGKFKRASDLVFGDVLLSRQGRTVSVERRTAALEIGTALVRARGGDAFFANGLLGRDPKVASPPPPKRARASSKRQAAPPAVEAPRELTELVLRDGWDIEAASESYDCMVVTKVALGKIPSATIALDVAARPRKAPAGRRGPASCAIDDVKADIERSFLDSLGTIAGMAPTHLQLEISTTSDCDGGNELSLCARFDEKRLAALVPESVYGQAGSSCFVAGTPVTTDRGEVAIEDLRPGDVVAAFDTRTNAMVTTRVTRVAEREHRPVATIDLSNGRALRVTAEHPFFVRGAGFVLAEQLAPGDELLGDDGEPVTVVATTAFDEDETVYDLSVGAPHDYFAGGVLVHNY